MFDAVRSYIPRWSDRRCPALFVLGGLRVRPGASLGAWDAVRCSRRGELRRGQRRLGELRLHDSRRLRPLRMDARSAESSRHLKRRRGHIRSDLFAGETGTLWQFTCGATGEPRLGDHAAEGEQHVGEPGAQVQGGEGLAERLSGGSRDVFEESVNGRAYERPA
jgi:hypothetical protein